MTLYLLPNNYWNSTCNCNDLTLKITINFDLGLLNGLLTVERSLCSFPLTSQTIRYVCIQNETSCEVRWFGILYNAILLTANAAESVKAHLYCVKTNQKKNQMWWLVQSNKSQWQPVDLMEQETFASAVCGIKTIFFSFPCLSSWSGRVCVFSEQQKHLNYTTHYSDCIRL